MVKPGTKCIAALTALAIAAFSVVCIVTCFSVAPAMPCCPHHSQQHARSWTPLFLAHPAAVLSETAPAPVSVRAALAVPEPARVLLVFLPPPVTLRI
jgi:hypothetical protein